MSRRPANSRVQHGEAACADYGCKRAECMEAARNRRRRNKYLLATGRPGFVSSARSAAHLQKFRMAGMQDNQIMALCGVARTTYYRALRGEPIKRDSERKILSVAAPAATGRITTTAIEDASGTHRRLQALIWLGWPPQELEARLGVHPGWINRTFRNSGVRLVLAAQVRQLYNALWSVRPESQGVAAGRADEAREYARSHGWNGPLAWDDDTIDDPTAGPIADASGETVTEGENLADRWLLGESVILRPEDRKQVIQHFFEWTELTVEEIAARLEMTPAAADQAWQRVKKKARQEGRKVPWRRVYVPRINQNDMEEVA